MKFWEYFYVSSFKKDSDGNELFFPWGIFGKGYILDSTETKQKIQKFIRVYFLVFFALLFLYVIFVQPYLFKVLNQIGSPLTPDKSASDFFYGFLVLILPIALIFQVIATIWWYIGMRSFIQKLPKTVVRLTWGESSKSAAKTAHPAFLWFGLIASICFVLITLLLIWQNAIPMWFAVISILLFGTLLMAYAYMIIVRNKP